MSIYVKGRLVIDDAEHERVFPLIRRAARFGPYFWIAVLAANVACLTVRAATDSWPAALLFTFVAGGLLGALAVDADQEHTVQRWMKEISP